MSRIINIGLVLVFVLLGLIGCSGLAGEPEIVATLPPQMFANEMPVNEVPEVEAAPAISPSIELGEQIYLQNCTACHGETGAGDGQLVLNGEIEMTADFTAAEVNDGVSPAEWYDVITNGRLEVLMPPWSGSLTDMERWSVTMYLYTLSYPAEQVAFGADLYTRECAECHGESGEGSVDGVALAGFSDQSDDALLTHITDGNGNMPAFADTLSIEERAAVVTHIRSLSTSGAIVETTMPEMASVPLAPSAPSAAVVMGDVTGEVVHGTAGGVIPDGLIAELHLMGGDFGEITLDAPVASDGTFAFEGIPFDPAHTIVVSVEYNDGTYVSEFVSGAGAPAQLELPVTVYDLTYDPSVLRISSLVAQIFTDGETLQVFEIVEVWNDSDRIYMGVEAADDGVENFQTVSFTLPENTEFIDLTGEGRYSVSADGRVITDSLPVLPGEPHVVHLAYLLPYDERASIMHVLDYPFQGRLEVHADAHGLAVESDRLAVVGSYQPGANTVLNAYGTAVDMQAGETFTYDVIGVDMPTVSNDSSEDTSILPYVFLGVGIAMVFGSGGFLVLDNRKRRKLENADPLTQDELIRQIAALDLAYQAGEIDEVAYLNERKQLKEQVAALIRDNRA